MPAETYEAQTLAWLYFVFVLFCVYLLLFYLSSGIQDSSNNLQRTIEIVYSRGLELKGYIGCS